MVVTGKLELVNMAGVEQVFLMHKQTLKSPPRCSEMEQAIYGSASNLTIQVCGVGSKCQKQLEKQH